MVEDISCLLGSGEVPNLFTPDEEADIIVRVRDAVRATGKPDTRVSENRAALAVASTPRATTAATNCQHASTKAFPPQTQYLARNKNCSPWSLRPILTFLCTIIG